MKEKSKIKLIFLALFCTISFCLEIQNSAELQIAYTNERLAELANKGQHYKTFMSFLQLHIDTADKLTDVIDLLEIVEDDIEQRFFALVKEYNTLTNEINQRLKSAQIVLDNSNERLFTVNQEIQLWNENIDRLQEEIQKILKQVIHLAQREKRINQARNIDIETYSFRKIRDENTLRQLQDILDRLNILYDKGDKFLQMPKEDIEYVLKLITLNDPARAFAHISSQFNSLELYQVISLLRSVESSIQASYMEDIERDEESVIHYNMLIHELEEMKEQFKETLKILNEELKQTEYDLKKDLAEKSSLVDIIDSNEKLIMQQKSALAKLIVIYDARIIETESTLDALKQAKQILQMHDLSVKNQEMAESYDQGNVIEGEIDTSGDLPQQEEQNGELTPIFGL